MEQSGLKGGAQSIDLVTLMRECGILLAVRPLNCCTKDKIHHLHDAISKLWKFLLLYTIHIYIYECVTFGRSGGPKLDTNIHVLDWHAPELNSFEVPVWQAGVELYCVFLN